MPSAPLSAGVKLSLRAAGVTLITVGIAREYLRSWQHRDSSSMGDMESAEASLLSPTEIMKKEGYYIKKKLLSSSQIQAIVSNLSKPAETAGGVEGAPRVTPPGKVVSKGRLHFNMLNSAFAESEEIKQLIADQILPIAVAELRLSDDQLMMTEVQIVNSQPGSDIQIWHADNSHRGITVLIPLVDFTEKNGPTELIAGSHDLPTNIWGGLSFARPLVLAGDGLVADARLLHRGGANESATSRPILVIRFDDKKTQPPGMTTVGATARYCFAMTFMFTDFILHYGK